jgi:hypothetical protein
MYPWIRITQVQKNEVFCIINIICKCIPTSEHVYLWSHNHDYKIDTSSWTNIIVHCSIQVTPISKLPWIRITQVQKNEVFCIINIICKCIRISLLSWLHTYSILIHDWCHIWTRGHWPLRITSLRSLFFIILFLTFQYLTVSRLKYNCSFWR